MKYQMIHKRVSREFETVMPTYCSNRSKDVEKMRASLEDGDFEVIRKLGHKMKGTGKGYQLDEISEIGLAIENCAVNKDITGIITFVEKLDYFLNHLVVDYIDS